MTSIAHLTGRAVLAVSGEDRVGYLQGLVSNDVALATADRAVWAALLTPQGKWLADFFILADKNRADKNRAEGDRLLMDVEAGQAAMLTQRLMRFRLRAKVVVVPVPLAVYAGWDGPPPQGLVLGAVLGAVPGAVPDPRLPQAGWRLLTDQPVETTVDAAAYDAHRLRLGLPDGSHDLEAEKTTLLEAGFDELHGVSWTKGCYMGQELTARTKYRGLLKRRLFPVAIDGPVPDPGTAVIADGAEVGIMRSAREGHGLVLLRIDSVGRTLTCGAADLRPSIPTWMTLPSVAEPS